MLHSLLVLAIVILPMKLLASKTKGSQSIVVHGKNFVVSISHRDIKKRVKALAAQINEDYAGKNPVLIGVLNGAFVFLSDLAREIDLECEVDFIKISSYGSATSSSGRIKLSKNVSCRIADRDVIIVEDTIDSGLSIEFARDLISKSNPRSIRIAVLLDKNQKQFDFPIDYIGFKIGPDFVVGYGLDYAQIGRNLKSIYRLDK